ncbi:MAG: D-alanyl-D-alanine carboxypeptidase/D-alanyl-D-alanine-endopeptidase [Pseudomonadota bacterium]
MVSRRIFLTSGLAGLAGAGWAQAPETSLFPSPRPSSIALRTAPGIDTLVADAGLGGRVGCAVADARTGEILELHNGLLGLPPASVSKSVTCAYALRRLGPEFRFQTRVWADGPLQNGRLDGDLWLEGGGDPLLVTDDINGLAQQLAETGLREVTGDLRLAVGALPEVSQIDPDQPPHVGYNPSVGALNLNFNRIHFEWERSSQGYTVRMDARSESIRPPINRIGMRVIDRAAPVYTYRQADGREEWTVARSALGNGGSRWLPVRNPARYTAEVFQVLTRSRGLVLDTVRVGGRVPGDATLLAVHESPVLREILRSMMRFSTNITAECSGLMASNAGGGSPGGLVASGGQMARWMRDGLSAQNPRFVDHSGLGEESRLCARDMASALVATGADGQVRSLMRPFLMRDRDGRFIENHPVEVVAKTGTLNFVSTLAGFARAPSGRDLAFAIFCADLPRRAALPDPQMERPDGGRAYNRRAKALQQALIERWAQVFGPSQG